MSDAPGSASERARDWWIRHGPRNRHADTGAFARLRRARDATDALIEPHAVQLVCDIGWRSPDLVCRVADLASLLAHVRRDDRGSKVATRLRGKNAEAPLMSSIRFQRLMQARDGNERRAAFRRVVTLLGDKVDVADFAEAWLFFDDPERGRSIRVDWLLRYAGGFSAESPAPAPNAESTPQETGTT